jgi:predicted RNA binding protein YcfA (HicA-like mRNA interferase family)
MWLEFFDIGNEERCISPVSFLLLFIFDLDEGIGFQRVETMKYRDVIKQLEANGWYLHSIVGSHQQFKHPVKTGRVTVAGKGGKDVPAGTLKSILKQAGLN